MIISIKELYETGVNGGYYTIVGKILEIKPKPTSTGSLRIAYKITDGTGKVDCVIFRDAQPEGYYLDVTAVFYGRFKELPPTGQYARGYRYLDIKELEDMHIADEAEEAGTRTEQVIEKKIEATKIPEIAVDFGDYVPTAWVKKMLWELVEYFSAKGRELEKKSNVSSSDIS